MTTTNVAGAIFMKPISKVFENFQDFTRRMNWPTGGPTDGRTKQRNWWSVIGWQKRNHTDDCNDIVISLPMLLILQNVGIRCKDIVDIP